MKEFFSKDVVENIEYNAQKQLREDIQNRWKKLGFTEGLPSDINKSAKCCHF